MAASVTGRSPSPPAAGRLPLLAYATGAFGLAMNAMVTFLVPLRADELGATLPVIGVLVGMKALMEALLSVPLGRVIDRIGARWAFVAGAGGSAVVILGFVASPVVWALFLCQALLGVTRPLGWVGSQTYVAALDAKAGGAAHTGRFSFVSNLGQIVGPLAVGAVAGVAGYRSAFLVLVVYAAGCVLIGLALPNLPEARVPQGSAAATLGETWGLLRERRIQVAMMLTFVRLWIPNVFTAFFPLFLVTGGLAVGLAGSVVSAMGVTATIVTLLTGRLSRHLTAELLTAIALGCGALGLAIAPLAAGWPLVYLPAIGVGIGQGLSLPLLITIVSGAAPPGRRGLALGLRSSVNQTAATVGPMIGGPVIQALGVGLGFPLSAAVAFTLLAGALLLHRRNGGAFLLAEPVAAR